MATAGEVLADYADEWNNWPSEAEANKRYRKGLKRGEFWGRNNPHAWTMTPEQIIDYAWRYRWSPDYAGGVWDGLRNAIPAEEWMRRGYPVYEPEPDEMFTR